MVYYKKTLISIGRKIEENEKLTTKEIDYICGFEKKEDVSSFLKFMQNAALPLSLLLGFSFSAFPSFFAKMIKPMPRWTNLSSSLLDGVNYIWNIFGEPVTEANIMYHLPNIALYSFGIFGLKKLFDTLDKRTWLDKVISAQTKLNERIQNGTLNIQLKKGSSILFVGKGDFIGAQFVLNHKKNEAITISEKKPSYTDIWNFYDANTTFQDLKDVLDRACSENTGEYIFFPVKDDKIFLPSPTAYDLSPHKLDILCQNIRRIEKENKSKPRRIIIVGDLYHRSFVQSEDKNGVLRDTEDLISLASISKKHKNVTVIDPTDIVLKKVLEIAQGRKIVFRATTEGMSEFKKRFYDRLEKLGYDDKKLKKGILTIGYDLSEDLTEQQTLARKIDDYYPVVLSKNVRDALIRNGYKKSEFIYVPELVLKTLSDTADEQ